MIYSKFQILLLSFFSLTICLWSAPLYALSFHDVLMLVEAGFDEQTLISQIKTTGSSFELTDADVATLKSNGASESLIEFLSSHNADEKSDTGNDRELTSPKDTVIRTYTRVTEDGKTVLCLSNLTEKGTRIGGKIPESERLRQYELTLPHETKSGESDVSADNCVSIVAQPPMNMPPAPQYVPPVPVTPPAQTHVHVNIQNTIVPPEPQQPTESLLWYGPAYNCRINPILPPTRKKTDKNKSYRLSNPINPANPFHMSNYFYPYGDRLRNLYFKHTNRAGQYQHIFAD